VIDTRPCRRARESTKHRTRDQYHNYGKPRNSGPLPWHTARTTQDREAAASMCDQPISATVDQVTIGLANGRRVTFANIDRNASGPACFILGVRKSGSSLLNSICGALANYNGRQLVDVGGTFFFSNVTLADWRRDLAVLDLLVPGNVYGGFRDMPHVLTQSALFATAPKLMMVRDPRDVLVSEYFSAAYSHPIPAPSADGDDVTRNMQNQRDNALQAGIDASVLWHADKIAATLMEYADVAFAPGTLLLRYEDYIFKKRKLLHAIADRFRWTLTSRLVDQILSWADLRPAAENPAAFVRRVTPGDHRIKLRRETIDSLNQTLSPVMGLFGYAP
jgi:Sulfotransferase domain